MMIVFWKCTRSVIVNNIPLENWIVQSLNQDDYNIGFISYIHYNKSWRLIDEKYSHKLYPDFKSLHSAKQFFENHLSSFGIKFLSDKDLNLL